MPDIQMVNREVGIAVLDDGSSAEVTSWYDDEGDECEPVDAVSCIAGPDREGRWWAIDLTEFKSATVH